MYRNPDIRVRNSLSSRCNIRVANGLWLFGSGFRSTVALAALALSSLGAYAVSDRAREACKADYYQHCSQFSVGTDELRQCMRKVGEGLSTPCLAALAQDGEITKADVERYHASQKGSAKAANPQGAKKTPEGNGASTKHDAHKGASAGKDGKKKAGKATKSADVAKLKSDDTSKKSKIANTKKSAKSKKEKVGKNEANGTKQSSGKKAKSADKSKKLKSAGAAKNVTAKAEKSSGTSKIKKADKAKNVDKVKKADKTEKTDKAKKTSKAAKATGAKTTANADKTPAKANKTPAKGKKSAKHSPTKKVKKANAGQTP